MDENPYAASDLKVEPTPTRTSDVSAREVFWAWEKLRLIYNGALGLVTVLTLGLEIFDPQFFEFVMIGAFGANLAFCAGSVGENYLTLFGIPRRVARGIIFGIGTIVSMVAVLVAISWEMEARF